MKKIEIVRIEFHNSGDYIMSRDQYEKEGKWSELIRSGAVAIKDVVKVHHTTMNESDFYNLPEWEG